MEKRYKLNNDYQNLKAGETKSFLQWQERLDLKASILSWLIDRNIFEEVKPERIKVKHYDTLCAWHVVKISKKLSESDFTAIENLLNGEGKEYSKEDMVNLLLHTDNEYTEEIALANVNEFLENRLNKQ